MDARWYGSAEVQRYGNTEVRKRIRLKVWRSRETEAWRHGSANARTIIAQKCGALRWERTAVGSYVVMESSKNIGAEAQKSRCTDALKHNGIESVKQKHLREGWRDIRRIWKKKRCKDRISEALGHRDPKAGRNEDRKPHLGHAKRGEFTCSVLSKARQLSFGQTF